MTQSGGSETRDVDWAMGAALLVRRKALDEVGGFDEGFFIYSEETDLCLRLRFAGWRLVTDAVHARGGKIFLQLWHVGRISHPSLPVSYTHLTLPTSDLV